MYLDWSSPASSGGLVIEGYRILVIPGGDVYTTSGNTTELVIEGMVPGEYRFQVSARSSFSSGENVLSDIVVLEPKPVPTETPEPTATPAPTPEPAATPVPIRLPQPTATPVAPSPPVFGAPVDIVPVPTRRPATRPPGRVATPTAIPRPEATITTTATLPSENRQNRTDGRYQRIELRAGWNLVSLRVIPENATIEAVLEQVAGKVTDITTIKDGRILHYSPGDRTGSNSLNALDPSHGYWIKMAAPAVLDVEGETVGSDHVVWLKKGWNQVSFAGDRPMPVSEALRYITGKFKEVRGFFGEGLTYLPEIPSEFNTLTTFEPGKGYLVYVTESTPLQYPDS